uniref:Uncharacterized protein n=1 Tax=Octopus bimaculoides TaxID=37653 RepID=A0A0L8GBX4_OCTBM
MMVCYCVRLGCASCRSQLLRRMCIHFCMHVIIKKICYQYSGQNTAEIYPFLIQVSICKCLFWFQFNLRLRKKQLFLTSGNEVGIE